MNPNQGFNQQGLNQQGFVQQGLTQQGLTQQGLTQQGLTHQHGDHHHIGQGLTHQHGDHHTHHHGHHQHGLVGGIPTTQSTTLHGVPTNQTVLSEIHGQHQGTYGQNITHQQHIPQQNYVQSTHLSGGQPLHFSGTQANVIPVGGVPGSVEQYATEALMRGVDPMNTQQHYNYNVLNGSTKPGFSGIPMNYSAGNTGSLLNQNPQHLTQTPLYSGSQPMHYEGDTGHAERLSNTHTTGHHNEGVGSKVEQRNEQKFGHHGTNTTEVKNPSTGHFGSA